MGFGHILLRWIVSALAILAVAYILPGVSVVSFWVALVVALVLGLINALLRPLAIFLTLPITLLTFGLFVLVINALLVQLAAAIVDGFVVDNFWWALVFSAVLSVVNWFVKPAKSAAGV
jgi:putative membrane protein